MIFKVDPSILTIFPFFSSAWIRIELKKEARANLEILDQMKEEALQTFLQKFPFCQNVELEQIPQIQQWMEGYRKMGLRPKKVKPTHYAFATRIVKVKVWPRSIGPLVDTYLVNQLNFLMPHGGFAMDSLEGYEQIEVLKSSKQTVFQPIGVQVDEEEKMEKTKEGEVIYRALSSDGEDVTLTRYLNYRDCEKTKIIDDQDEVKSTKDFILIIENIDPSKEGREHLSKTAFALEKSYQSIFGDSVQRSFVRFLECGPISKTADARNEIPSLNDSISLDW